jgi:hypothetical protein
MKKDYEILLKRNALHEYPLLTRNDIKRIQTMSKKTALLKGDRQGELVRLKKTLRKQNQLIQRSKGLDSGLGGFSAAVPSADAGQQADRHALDELEAREPDA